MASRFQELVEYLVGRRFPKDRKSKTRPGTPSVAARIARTQKLMVQYRGELKKLSETELAERARLARENEAAQRAKVQSERDRFFNQSNSSGDFERWAKESRWTVDEAVALSFGKAPEHVSWQRLQPLLNASPFAEQFKRRRDLLLKAAGLKELRNPIAPSAFLTWAKGRNLALPPALETAVLCWSTAAEWEAKHAALQTKFKKEEEKWLAQVKAKSVQIDRLNSEVMDLRNRTSAPQKPDAPLATKERDSLFKLVIGMAIGGYGYEPADARSKQPAAIASDIVAQGMSLDVDTVRKWLKSAAELLPREQR